MRILLGVKSFEETTVGELGMGIDDYEIIVDGDLQEVHKFKEIKFNV